jgi:hypothetical protein
VRTFSTGSRRPLRGRSAPALCPGRALAGACGLAAGPPRVGRGEWAEGFEVSRGSEKRCPRRTGRSPRWPAGPACCVRGWPDGISSTSRRAITPRQGGSFGARSRRRRGAPLTRRDRAAPGRRDAARPPTSLINCRLAPAQEKPNRKFPTYRALPSDLPHSRKQLVAPSLLSPTSTGPAAPFP